MTPTLSIVMPTAGRDTLVRAFASLAPQLEDGDEIIVVRRDGVLCGNQPRDEAMRRCIGSHLWWMDDDDIATDGALEIIRREVAQDPGTVHIFKMRMNGGVFWPQPTFIYGHVGGTMCVVPNLPDKLGTWVHALDYGNGVGRGGDFHFVRGTLDKLGREPIFHEDVIARIRP